MNKKSQTRIKVVSMIIVLSIISILLISSSQAGILDFLFGKGEESAFVSGGGQDITYTPSTKEVCNGGKCWKTLYSGAMYTNESDGWHTLPEVSNITWVDDAFRFSYRDYWVDIEPLIIYNGQVKTMQDIRDAFPGVSIVDYVTPQTFNHKFALNFTSVPQNLIDNIDWVVFHLKQSNGITWEDVEKTGDRSIVIKDKIKINYQDLISSNYVLNLINKTHLLIGNISRNAHNGVISLDPTIKLDDINSESLADVMTSYEGSFEEGVASKWNLSSIPAGRTIQSAQQCFYWVVVEDAGSLDNDVTIWRIDNQTWDETITPTGFTALPLTNQTSDTWSSITQSTWGCTNVTKMVKYDWDNGNTNTSLYFEDPDFDVVSFDVIYDELGNYANMIGDADSTDLRGEDREDTLSSGNLPYLNVTYSLCGNGQCIFDDSYDDADVKIQTGGKLVSDTGYMIRWNISAFLDEGKACEDITGANMQLYIKSKNQFPDNDYRVWFLNDETWVESDSAASLEAISKLNQTDGTMTSTTATTYTNFSVLNALKYNCQNHNNTGFSLRVEDVDNLLASIDTRTDSELIMGDVSGIFPTYFTFEDREEATASQRPKLFIKYNTGEEDDPPVVNLTFPPTANRTNEIDISFRCNATDDNSISNSTAYMWWSNGTFYNKSSSNTSTGAALSYIHEIHGIAEGNFSWNCLVEDDASQTSRAINNNTIQINQSLLDIYVNYTTSNINISKVFGSYAFWEWYTDDVSLVDSCWVKDENSSKTFDGIISNEICTLNVSLNHSNTGGNNFTLNMHNLTFHMTASGGKTGSTVGNWINVTSLPDVNGFLIMRAPVNEVDVESGGSRSRRFGSQLGNGQDVGMLWKANTLDDNGKLLQDEERHCGTWGSIFMDEYGYGNGTIKHAYCHVWVLDTQQELQACWRQGYGDNCFTGQAIHTRLNISEFPETYIKGQATNYNMSILNWTNIDLSYNGSLPFNDWSFTLRSKVGSTAGNPQILMYKNQNSFCIINEFNGVELNDTATLNTTDFDGDGLTDFQELYVTYTDPTDADTDNDTYSDLTEFSNNKDGWDPYDWGTITKYRINGTFGNVGYYEKEENQGSQPGGESWNSSLTTEYNSPEYGKLEFYDGIYNTISTTQTANTWGRVQSNFHVNITQDPTTISNINIFWAGRSEDNTSIDTENKSSHIMNHSGGNEPIIPGKKGETSAMFLKQIRGNPSDYINGSGYLHYGFNMKVQDAQSSWYWRVILDYAEVWVVTGSSYVQIDAPTTTAKVNKTTDDILSVNFTFVESDVEILSGVSVMNITLNSTICVLSGTTVYDTDHWEQNCTVPELPSKGNYSINISANTSTSGMLSDVEVNAVRYTLKSMRPISNPITINFKSIKKSLFTINNMLSFSLKFITNRFLFFIVEIKESFSFNDITNRFILAIRFPSQILTLLGFLGKFSLGNRILSQNININDQVDSQANLFRDTFQSFSIKDQVGRVFSKIRNPNNKISINDFLISQAQFMRENSQPIKFNLFMNRLKDFIRKSNKNIIVNDELNRKGSSFRLSSQSFIVFNDLNRIFLRIVYFDQNIILKQESDSTSFAFRILSQKFVIVDDINRLFLGIRGLDQNIIFSDSISTEKGVIRQVYQLFNVFFDTSKKTSFSRSSNQKLTIADDINRLFLGLRGINQKIIINDESGFNRGYLRESYNPFSILSDLIKKLFGIRETNEIITINEGIDSKSSMFRINNQKLTIADDVSRLFLGLRGLNQNIIFDDSISTNTGILRLMYQKINYFSDMNKYSSLFIINMQKFSFYDDVNRLFLGLRGIDQKIIINDESGFNRGYLRESFNPLSILTDLIKKLLGIREVNQKIIINTQVDSQASMLRINNQKFTIADDVSRILLGLRGTSQKIVMNEESYSQLSSQRGLFQIFVIRDDLNRLFLGLRGIDQVIIINDEIFRRKSYLRLLHQQIFVNDFINKIFLGLRGINQQIIINSDMNRLFLGIRGVSQNIIIKEDVSRTGNFLRTAYSQIILSERGNVTYTIIFDTFNRIINNPFNVFSDISRIFNKQISIEQKIAISELIDKFSLSLKEMYQKIFINDFLERIFFGSRGIEQNIIINNDLNKNFGVLRNTDQSFMMFNTMKKIVLFDRNIDQIINFNMFTGRQGQFNARMSQILSFFSDINFFTGVFTPLGSGGSVPFTITKIKTVTEFLFKVGILQILALISVFLFILMLAYYVYDSHFKEQRKDNKMHKLILFIAITLIILILIVLLYYLFKI